MFSEGYGRFSKGFGRLFKDCGRFFLLARMLRGIYASRPCCLTSLFIVRRFGLKSSQVRLSSVAELVGLSHA